MMRSVCSSKPRTTKTDKQSHRHCTSLASSQRSSSLLRSGSSSPSSNGHTTRMTSGSSQPSDKRVSRHSVPKSTSSRSTSEDTSPKSRVSYVSTLGEDSTNVYKGFLSVICREYPQNYKTIMLSAMVRLNTQNLLVFGDVIDFQRPKPMVIGGEPGSSNNLPFDGLIMRGNDMKLTSTNKDKLYLVYENDVKIYLDILPEFAFEQIIFQLQFMIGISKKTDFSKLLTVYICTKDINLKSLKQNKSTKGYSPSLDCSYIINSTISSTVMLSEAKLLKDFLVLRFQTENSVTYVRFEKYDFAKLEIYLKGYSPDFVWMAQTDSNKIILCHFKYDAPNPFSLFVSDGELLQNLPTLNLDMYRQVRQKVFKAGSLIQEDGPVYLYLAMALKVKETSAKNNYRGSISFMKYEVFDNGAPPKVRLRGHNVFTADFLMNRRGDVCFLMNKMVILTEEIIQDDVDFDPVYEVRVYLIDLLNPEFQYEVPLKEYDVSNMMDSKVICSLENNLIIVQGFLEKGNLKRAINILLSGDFQQAHKRILRISDKLAGDSCTLSCTSVYMVEACMNKSLEGKVPFNFKIQALVSPKVHFLYDPADFNPMALGSTTEVEIKARAGTK